MTPTHRMRISFAGMLAWVAPMGLAVGGLGTWKFAGGEGLTVQLAAGAVALVGVCLGGWVVVYSAARGPGRATLTFIVVGLVQMLVCTALVTLAITVLALPPAPMLLWFVVLYLAMFSGQVIWLARALRRDASRAAGGEFRPFGRARWSE